MQTPHTADPSQPDTPRWLTVAEFKARYRVGHTFAHSLLKLGAVQRVKVGRATRITRESAEAWAAGLEQGGAS